MNKLYQIGLVGSLIASSAISVSANKFSPIGSDNFRKMASVERGSQRKTVKRVKINKGNSLKKDCAQFSHLTISSSKSSVSKMRKADWEAYSTDFNIKAVYDEESANLECIVAYDYYGLTQEWFYPEESGIKEVELSLPSTYTYIFLAYFTNYDEYGYETYSSYVVLDNVEPRGNASMDLVFDLSTATNEISAEGRYPDGDVFQIAKVGIEDTDEGPELITVEEGNVSGVLTVRGGLYHKQLGELFWSQVSGYCDYVENEDYPDFAEPTMSERSTLHINDLSDDFIVTMTITATNDDDSPCYVDLRKEGTASETLSNNSTDYVDIINDMMPSQLALRGKYPASEEPFSISSTHYLGNIEVSGMSLEGGELLQKVMYCNAPEKYRSDSYRTGFQAWREDLVTYYSCDTTYEDGWMWIEEERTSTNNIAPTVVVNGDNTTFVLAETDPLFYEHSHFNGTLADRVHPLFRQTMEERGYTLGTGTVYSSNLVHPYNEGIVPFDVEYYGMCQEICGAYSSVATPTIFYNGEEVDYDKEYYGDFWSGGFYGWCHDWNAERHPAGSYDISFMSPNYVDGIDETGMLLTNFRFDQTKEDNVPPAVQYVQLRDKNGFITNILSNPEDGVLRIVAGDFYVPNDCDCINSMYPKYNYNDECIPTVAYHYFGEMTEGWSHLTVKKEMDAFGYFAPCYTVDLGEMLVHSDIQAADGWVEISISMTDKAGNEMSQTLSPLFKIDGFSGVKTFAAAGVSARVCGRNLIINGIVNPAIEVYSVSGMCVMSERGNNISLNSLAAGTYVARIGDGSNKTVIKFIVR